MEAQARIYLRVYKSLRSNSSEIFLLQLTPGSGT